MKKNDNMHLLKKYIPIADMITENFGKNCETVIHDFSNINSSLVYIKGNVTGRTLGAPTTNVILQHLRKNDNDLSDITGFKTKTKDGKVIKTSISFIRNEEEHIIGCLGINFNISAFENINQIINDFTETSDLNEIEPELELYENNMKDIFESMVDITLDSVGKPVESMKREDKQIVVQKLDEKGIFLMQGSIDKISDILSISKQTVYNYLEKEIT